MRLSRKRVVLVGLFSAKAPDPHTEIDSLARHVEAAGGAVVARLVQRHGVSRGKGPGGAVRMNGPVSKSTVIGSGKVREVAETCAMTGADVVIFTNDLTDRQRETLEKQIGVRVQDAAKLGLRD